MVPPPKQEPTQETTQETKPKKRKIIIVKKKRIVKKKKPTESNHQEITPTPASKPKLTTEELKKAYLQNLDEKERIAMEIAKDHLKTSFDLEKCIDFKNWSSKK